MKKNKQLKMVERFAAVGLMLAGILSINVYFYGAFREQISLINVSARQQVIEGISDYYTQVDVTTSTVMQNPHFTDLASLKTQKEAYQSESSSEVISLFKTLDGLPGAINYIYVYLEEIDLIISRDGVIGRNVFFDVVGKAYASTPEEWDRMAVTPEEKSGFEVVGDSVVFTARQRFKGSNVSYTIGMIADLGDVFMDNTNAEWIDSSNVYVFDRYGTLRLKNENMEITSLDENPSYSEIYGLRGEYDFVIQSVSVGDDQYDIYFLFEIGLDMMLVKQLQVMLAVVMLISFGVFFYFMYLQIVERYRPFKELAELLKIEEPGVDFRVLHSPIENVINDNADLNRQIEDRNSVLNKLIFEKLLSGNLKGSSREELSKLGFQFRHNGYAVVAIYLYNDMDATVEMKQEIADAIAAEVKKKLENEESSVYLVSMDEYMVCLLNSDEENLSAKNLKGKFEEIIEPVDIRYDLVISVVVSKACGELWQISLAYSDVLDVIRKSELYRKSRVILCEDEKREERSSDFDLACETELMLALKNGNYDAAEEIIHRYTEPCGENKADDVYCNKSLELVYALIRISGGESKFRSNMQSIFMALKNIENAELVRKVCCDFAKKICREARNISKKDHLAGEVLKLIHENYGDSQFCLESISDTLGFSAVHLNNQFKEAYNMTIVAYLGNYRIQKAKEFILDGIAIKEVVGKVGISNARTFNRLFHSVTGMTPSEYKSKSKKEKM